MAKLSFIYKCFVKKLFVPVSSFVFASRTVCRQATLEKCAYPAPGGDWPRYQGFLSAIFSPLYAAPFHGVYPRFSAGLFLFEQVVKSVFSPAGVFVGIVLRRRFLFGENKFFAEVRPVFINHGFFHGGETLVRFRAVIKFAVKAAAQGRQAFRADVPCARLASPFPGG